MNRIRRDMIMNCSVTLEDINNSVKNFGPDIDGLQGWRMGREPIPMQTSLIEVPKRIFKLHHLITITIDILFVNNVQFLK